MKKLNQYFNNFVAVNSMTSEKSSTGESLNGEYIDYMSTLTLSEID